MIDIWFEICKKQKKTKRRAYLNFVVCQGFFGSQIPILVLEVQFWEFYDGEKGKNMICVEFRIEF